MAGKRVFFTGSTAIISDPRPSGLDMRVYACVSEHDGMSLKKGKGPGCYATYETLTASLKCDASNLSKSLKRLVDWGYLKEERQADRRRKTYRVVFDFPEGWRNDQQSMVGEIANNQGEELPLCSGQVTPKDVGNAANQLTEIVGNGNDENGVNPLQDGQHYSSLKGLDPLEREKLDSFEKAHLAARHARQKVKLDQNVGAQLAILERAWKEDPGSFDDQLLIERTAWLQELSDQAEPGDPDTMRAQRLYFDFDLAMFERNLGPYGEAAA